MSIRAGKWKNLHEYWDAAPGTGGLKTVPDFVAKLPKPDKALASNTDAKVWIDESVELAKNKVYVGPIGPTLAPKREPYKLDEAYGNEAKTASIERVNLAGYRLAEILNNELK